MIDIIIINGISIIIIWYYIWYYIYGISGSSSSGYFFFYKWGWTHSFKVSRREPVIVTTIQIIIGLLLSNTKKPTPVQLYKHFIVKK